MKYRRNFANEPKRQIVGELLSGASTPAQLIRRYEISSRLLYHWKEQYAKGRFNNEAAKEAALEARVSQRERFVGKLTGTPGNTIRVSGKKFKNKKAFQDYHEDIESMQAMLQFLIQRIA